MKQKENRTAKIEVRMLADEKAQIQAHVSAQDATLSEFCRRVVLDACNGNRLVFEGTKKGVEIEERTVLELIRIGTNLNQIAKVINEINAREGGSFETLQHLADLASVLEKVEDLQDEILDKIE